MKINSSSVGLTLLIKIFHSSYRFTSASARHLSQLALSCVAKLKVKISWPVAPKQRRRSDRNMELLRWPRGGLEGR